MGLWRVLKVVIFLSYTMRENFQGKLPPAIYKIFPQSKLTRKNTGTRRNQVKSSKLTHLTWSGLLHFYSLCHALLHVLYVHLSPTHTPRLGFSRAQHARIVILQPEQHVLGRMLLKKALVLCWSHITHTFNICKLNSMCSVMFCREGGR